MGATRYARRNLKTFGTLRFRRYEQLGAIRFRSFPSGVGDYHRESDIYGVLKD